MLEKLGECFGLHRLVTEDLMSVVQRPKIEDFGDYLFVVLKMLSPGREGRPDRSGAGKPHRGIELRAFLPGGHQGRRVQPLIRDRLRTGKGKIRKMGVDYLAYSLLDALVDGYFVILEKLGENASICSRTSSSPSPGKTRPTDLQLKRELLFLHKAVWPLREVVSSLARRESPLIRETTAPYLRDVYDHVVQAIDSVEIYRETCSRPCSTCTFRASATG